MSERVVIIGGGVIGAFSAYHLAQRGFEVRIVEQSKFGRGCSHANCGLVCPSHVLPLCVPGAVGKTLSAMFKGNAPLYIKPRLSKSLWSWFWKFSRRCKRHHMIAAGHARSALLESSMTAYERFITEHGLDVEWERNGTLLVHHNEEEFEGFEETNAFISETFGVSARRIEGNDLVEFEPALVDGLAGGYHYECDAHLRSDKLMTAMRQVIENQGVEILEDTEIVGFDSSRNRCESVVTKNGDRLAADHFLLATGAMAPLLERQLRVRLPIQPGKGYSITMQRPQKCPRLPLLFESHRVVVTPMQSGYRLGSTMEFSGYDTSLNKSRLAALKSGAEHYLHQPYTEQVDEEWFGWRPMTYDGIPIIDSCPKVENVWVAAGHNMLGLSMAPATGQLIGEMIAGEETHLDRESYSLSRF